MVEFRSQFPFAPMNEVTEWKKMTHVADRPASTFLFYSGIVYRINDVEFLEYSPEFEEALEKERVWAKLQNG